MALVGRLLTSAQGCSLWKEIEQLANAFSCNYAHGWGRLKEEDRVDSSKAFGVDEPG